MEKFTIQEGEYIPPIIEQLFKNHFNHKDTQIKDDGSISNFSGFIILNDKLLVSFPKHFLTKSELHQSYISSDNINFEKHSKLLFNTIYKASSKTSVLGKEITKDLEENFPFRAFLNVYEYYKKYGLYKKEIHTKKYGYDGEIDWKSSIEKSSLIFNNNNIIFIPLVIREKLYHYEFLSKCMAYIINSSADTLSIFIPITKVHYDYKDIDWRNTKRIIKELRKLLRSSFKDIDKNLILSIIQFFENKNHVTNGIKIKIHTFYLIWEDMVQEYLNNYFLDISTFTDNQNVVRHKLTFSEKPLPQKLGFLKKTFFTDARGTSGFSLELDHYLATKSNIYIFDSKYYQKLTGLNYKQVSYYFLLNNQNNPSMNLNTYNALLLPTSRNMADFENFKYHYIHSKEFSYNNQTFFIIEQYLNTLHVMNMYQNKVKQ
ncbi:hypothetical protein [Staphylococcus xylosus]|uniref:hypothetical protein n=1 Tax=Staphylococcus xylosus TaxID=1288 RepID=UPI003F544F7F